MSKTAQYQFYKICHLLTETCSFVHLEWSTTVCNIAHISQGFLLYSLLFVQCKLECLSKKLCMMSVWFIINLCQLYGKKTTSNSTQLHKMARYLKHEILYSWMCTNHWCLYLLFLYLRGSTMNTDWLSYTGCLTIPIYQCDFEQRSLAWPYSNNSEFHYLTT